MNVTGVQIRSISASVGMRTEGGGKTARAGLIGVRCTSEVFGKTSGGSVSTRTFTGGGGVGIEGRMRMTALAAGGIGDTAPASAGITAAGSDGDDDEAVGGFGRGAPASAGNTAAGCCPPPGIDAAEA